MRFIQYLAVVGMAVLAACGQEPAAQSAPTVTSQGDFTFEPGSFDTLINRARAQRGLSPLRVSAKLTTAARAHANDMSRGEFFSHNSSDGRSVGARVAANRLWPLLGIGKHFMEPKIRGRGFRPLDGIIRTSRQYAGA